MTGDRWWFKQKWRKLERLYLILQKPPTHCITSIFCSVLFIHTNRNTHLVSLPLSFRHIMNVHRRTWRFGGVYSTRQGISFLSPSFPNPFFLKGVFRGNMKDAWGSKRSRRKKILSVAAQERIVILFSLLFLFLFSWQLLGKEICRKNHATPEFVLSLKRSHKISQRDRHTRGAAGTP